MLAWFGFSVPQAVWQWLTRLWHEVSMSSGVQPGKVSRKPHVMLCMHQTIGGIVSACKWCFVLYVKGIVCLLCPLVKFDLPSHVLSTHHTFVASSSAFFLCAASCCFLTVVLLFPYPSCLLLPAKEQTWASQNAWCIEWLKSLDTNAST